MTSATVTSNDFMTIMKEHRAYAHKRLANPYVGFFVPSAQAQAAYERLRSHPVSNSDSDTFVAATKAINSVSNTGATITSDDSQTDVTKLTADYQDSMKSGDATAGQTFKEKMEASKNKAKQNADAAIDKSYDKAEALASNMTPADQNKILSFMDTVTNGFSRVLGKITDFIINAIHDLVTWVTDVFNYIKKGFSTIVSFIGSIF